MRKFAKLNLLVVSMSLKNDEKNSLQFILHCHLLKTASNRYYWIQYSELNCVSIASC